MSMSLAETNTPMSVDKSAMEIEQVQKSLAIKNDRDRCFEIAEYRNDILKYLKVVEVNFLLPPPFFQLIKMIVI